MRDKVGIIGRGRAGWHCEGTFSSSGGTLNSYMERYECEGALVYDAEAADTSAFVRHVMSGPMVDLSLPVDGVDRLSSEDRQVALCMSPALGGSYRTLALMSQDESFCGLDRVGVGVFEALLSAIPGMKIGRVVKGEVVWHM